ncbi:MAG: sn-glycerol-3-phosphate ABC transporter ATP-binding protein UgpC [Oscillospiraceae bacterium]
MKKIEGIGLSKTYDGKTKILSSIDLQVEEGEFFILVGPSGCGKSTLLRMIAGLEKITGGTLKIDGAVANKMEPKDRQLSMVFQNYALYPHMTVRENILFGLDVRKIPKDEQEHRLKEVAELIGLQDLLKRKPRELSGGQRQRVALARSICSEAPICLMDEPLSNLDAKLRAQMRTEICRIQKERGLTVVYVTHDQIEAMTMGDRIMVLHDGVIQQTGTPLELYNHPTNQFVASFIGSPQMNLAQGEINREALVLNGSLSIPLDWEELPRLPGGIHWTVGIRAEKIERSTATDELSVPVSVVNTELMGNETQVIFKVGSALFTARWQGQFRIENGSEIYVRFPLSAFHFFEQESGRLLKSAAVFEESPPPFILTAAI